MLCDVAAELQRSGELELLLERIESQDTAVPLEQLPPPPRVKYPGRWGKGRAPCRALSRVEVDAFGNVRCCRHGDPLGKIGDSRRALAKRLTELAKAAEQRRGCVQCANLQCPRCPFPGVDDATYCGFMTKHERAQSLLNRMQLYSRLPMLIAIQQDNMTAG